MIQEIISVWQANQLTLRTIEHLYMFGVALTLASIIGVALGMLIYSNERVANTTINALNILETIPDIPMLVLLLPIVGLGTTPTIIASILYSILPITRNTYTGLKGVDAQYIYIARAMGLSTKEILYKVRFPLSLPLIAGGIRIALVFTMGVVTLGGLIAAGGLGTVLIVGIQLYDVNAILVAGLWTGALAVLLDMVAGVIENKLKRRFSSW